MKIYFLRKNQNYYTIIYHSLTHAKTKIAYKK